jgi:squalene-hopene/tetraprenyl-beta-curcumene cyclase
MSQLAEVVSETLTAPVSLREEALAKLDYAIERAQRSLIDKQHAEGYWHAPLEANAEMNAEFIIFNHFMDTVDVEQEAKLKKLLLDQQNADGSWSLFPEGLGHLSTSIEVYFALKLAGMRAGDEPMIEARRWILSQGGIEKCGTLARFYLAAMGQVPWDATASVPVEAALLPNWFPFNMYELSSWARGTTFALMILQAMRPAVKVNHQDGVLELYIQPPHFTKFKQPRPKRALSLRTVFNLIDKVLRVYDHHNLKGLRARALAYAENWIVEHQDANGSWGGIQPCYLLSAMALKALGYRNHHPVLKSAIDASRELVWDLGDALLYMPCVSPNWDTALAAKALIDSGTAGDHPALRRAAQWLIEHQIFRRGDWSIKRPGLDPAGWAFQFYNDWYPDVDDSAVILMVLAETACDDSARRERAISAGATWVMGMQSKDGGFAAFDADNDSHWLNSLPLADVEAVTDPSCADLTGRVLEMMAAVGYQQDHPAARRAIEWLRRNQQADGAWWGRWGIAYIYGTFSALSGLRAIGYDMKQPWIRRAVDWLRSKQNADGGWGESPLANSDPAWRGRGTSTASQTAWAVIGLLAGEEGASETLLRGVQWLVERQNENGAWDENEFTGTGFPGHFYLRYWLYSHYFPLMALGRFRVCLKETVSK